MSMISSLIDELRKSADEWNGSNMFELAHMCSEAADTIWQLRDDLQRANEAVRDAEHDESMAWDRVRKAEAENAKLRDEKIDAYNEKVVAQLEADELRAENSKLRKRVAELDELLPENGRWYRAETVEAYVTEIAKLRELVADMWLQLLNAYDRMQELGIEP